MGLPLARLVALCLALTLARGEELRKGEGQRAALWAARPEGTGHPGQPSADGPTWEEEAILFCQHLGQPGIFWGRQAGSSFLQPPPLLTLGGGKEGRRKGTRERRRQGGKDRWSWAPVIPLKAIASTERSRG